LWRYCNLALFFAKLWVLFVYSKLALGIVPPSTVGISSLIILFAPPAGKLPLTAFCTSAMVFCDTRDYLVMS
jgi:hypothetical protein